jgi:hypothetical protein
VLIKNSEQGNRTLNNGGLGLMVEKDFHEKKKPLKL